MISQIPVQPDFDHISFKVAITAVIDRKGPGDYNDARKEVRIWSKHQ